MEGILQGKLKGLQRGKLEGLQLGKLEGLQLGKLEGQRKTLIRLIERKFGETLSKNQLDKIQNAASAELDQLAERIFDANSTKELFQGEH